MLDGLGSTQEYVDLAVQMGQPALALTDHGNLCGASEFYKQARKAGLEPIIGFEAYFVKDIEKSREDKDRERSHVTMLARSYEGYKILAEINTESWRNFYYKPLVDRAMLESLGDATQHLTVLSGCAGSMLSRHLRAEEEDEAREEVMWWRETFPHYYIELMHHNTEFDVRLNESLIAMARKYDIPWAITNDPHFALKEDHIHQEVLLAIQTNDKMSNPDRFKFDGDGYYLKSRQEMAKAFKQYGDDIWKPGAAATLQIAKESRTRIPAWESKSWQIPSFPDVEDSQKELKRLAYQGLRRIGKRDDEVYVNRIRDELRVIRQTGIADFLLITRDIIRWAESQGIRVGPGRGSVAGTLVGYLIGIHKVDSVKYNLIFERFLNPARPKMPDIDTDFSQERRGEVFDYVIEKYGAENTMHVAAFGKLQVKSCFNALARTLGIPFLEAQEINKQITDDVDEDTGIKSFSLPDKVTERFPEIEFHMRRLIGTRQRISAHPAGLIIADPKVEIRKQIPELYIPSSKRFVGQFDKKAVEAMGFMKEDFLGLRTLDTIDEAVRLIEERQGIDLDPDSWIPDEEEDDELVYSMLAKGRTAGVFQMEGPANQRGCKDVNPVCFEDLVSITSLYRTGAISAGFPKIFNENRKKGIDNVEYIHPALKPILEPTWGVVLYQEQVMEFASTLAGFDMGMVDDIKEAIKDKSSDDMMAMKEPFIAGCKVTQGMSRKTAEKIWHMIEGYSGYGYNRAHAVAYTLATYQTARLKCLYPIEYTCALLRTVPNDKDNKAKREVYLQEAVDNEIKVRPPDINLSGLGATPMLHKEVIRFGLTDYKGIGPKQAMKIIKARPAGGFTSVAQVAQAANNVGVMRVLEEGSALRSLGLKGLSGPTEELLGWTFTDRMKKHRIAYGDQFEPPDNAVEEDEQVILIGMIYHTEQGKTKASGAEYCTWRLRWSIAETFDVRLWDSTRRKCWGLPVGTVVRVEGKWLKKWLNVSVGDPNDVTVLAPART